MYGSDSNGIIKVYGVLTNRTFTIQKVAYVTDLKHNIINVAMLTDAKFRIEFDENIYPLDIKLIIGKPQLCFLVKVAYDEIWFWH